MGKNILLLEKPAHIHIAVNHLNENSILVPTSSDSAYEAERRGIPFQFIHNYYTQEEYYELFDETENIRRRIITYFDSIILDIDTNFKEQGLKPFYYNDYLLQLCLDDLQSTIFRVLKLLEAEDFSAITLIRFQETKIPTYFEIDRESVYNSVVPLLAQTYGFSVEWIDAGTLLFEQPKRLFHPQRIKQITPRKLWNKLAKVSATVSNKVCSLLSHQTRSKKRCLNISCKELTFLEKALKKKDWTLVDFNPKRFKDAIAASSDYGLSDTFWKYVRNGNQEVFNFRGINFLPVLQEKLNPFINELGRYYTAHDWLSSYLLIEGEFDLVAFGTHTPMEYQNVLAAKICSEHKIPYFCWMHGGYGCSYSTPGFGNTDYLYGSNYLVYGENVKKLVDAISNSRGYGLNTFVAGSPHIEAFRQSYRRPKNKVKEIVFVLSGFGANNEVLGMKNPEWVSRNWKVINRTIKVLVKYENKYKIIIRTYGDSTSPQTVLIEKLLSDLNATKITLVPHDVRNLLDIYLMTDLIILPYASTSMMQGCMTHSDIFLFDCGDITEDARKLIQNRIYWFDNIEKYCDGLQEYLDKGIFHQKSGDQTFVNKYLDFSNMKRREEVVEEILNALQKN